ncbi:helix-turn-helix domain-containing protein [Bailinhaonella thermotolerans]|uniref:helix-turn-helix domain-containing protein n=1 Tax=Bailinhaonella thermotolerans TaxID=1070861 RepID=UPI00192A2270|nr:helix-turn-helix transcriptional regulator [Bailinhaonella thermotolerans]
MSQRDQVEAVRKAFGQRLRGLRLDARLNGRQLSARSGMHTSKISRIELGRQNPTEEDIRVWCRACRAEDQIPELIAAHRQIDEMWEDHRQALRAGLAQQSERVKPLYEQTRLIRAYEPQTVPGFLQRPGYTRAVIEDVTRFHGLATDIDEAVEGRLNRLRVLESGTCMFSFVIEAGALYAQRGGLAVMLDQFDYIERAADFANVALGIIPLGRLRTIWPGEGFYIYDQSLVRSEHWTGGYRTKRPSEIETYLRIFKLLQSLAVYGDSARAEIDAARRLLQSREIF